MNWKQGFFAGFGFIILLVVLFFPACSFQQDSAVARKEQLVQFVSGEGVPAEALAEVRQAAEATGRFFSETAGMRLKEPVTIVLTKDRNSFVGEAMKRFNIGELEAKRVSKGVDALSGADVIVINVGGVPTARQKTFLTAHELTHHYQRQITGKRTDGAIWLLEGMAEMVGAQVVDRQGYWSLRQYRANWRQGLEASAKKPGLEELKSGEDWSISLSRHGSALTYVTAGYAVLLLSDQFGQAKLWDYFSGLGRGENSEESFQRVFGMSLADFARYYAQSLRKAS